MDLEKPPLVVLPDSRWSLVTRACAVESKNEAITVKLATERDLDDDALRNLGLFRQAIQQLRESILDNEEVPACLGHDQTEYVFFNELAVKVGSIISSSKPIDESSDQKTAIEHRKTAIERFGKVASYRKPEYDRALDDFHKKHPHLKEPIKRPKEIFFDSQ